MASPQVTLLNCTQCGGELHPDEGQLFITCPYCSATVYIDKSRVVFHWYVAPTLNEQQALAALYRWMSGSQTVKDLDKKAQVTGQAFQFFPLWYFKSKTIKGEQIHLQPAAATSVTELSRLNLPAGDLRRYEDSLDAQSVEPSVPLDAALAWLGGAVQPGAALPQPGSAAPAIEPAGPTSVSTPRTAAPAVEPAGPTSVSKARVAAPAVLEMALVHVPVFLYKYQFRGETFTALVDAASGTVLANLYPAKAEAPYLLVGGVTAVVYLCLALALLVGALVDTDGTAVLIGAGVCVGGGLLVSPFLFMWAYMVAAKV